MAYLHWACMLYDSLFGSQTELCLPTRMFNGCNRGDLLKPFALFRSERKYSLSKQDSVVMMSIFDIVFFKVSLRDVV